MSINFSTSDTTTEEMLSYADVCGKFNFPMFEATNDESIASLCAAGYLKEKKLSKAEIKKLENTRFKDMASARSKYLFTGLHGAGRQVNP